MTTREMILKALESGPKSSTQLLEIAKTSKENVYEVRRSLMRHGLVEKCSQIKVQNNGTGWEGVYCLTDKNVKKVKAKNPFDWRNWEPQAAYSERELAYSNASYLNRKETRVIVYSRA